MIEKQTGSGFGKAYAITNAIQRLIHVVEFIQIGQWVGIQKGWEGYGEWGCFRGEGIHFEKKMQMSQMLSPNEFT